MFGFVSAKKHRELNKYSLGLVMKCDNLKSECDRLTKDRAMLKELAETLQKERDDLREALSDREAELDGYRISWEIQKTTIAELRAALKAAEDKIQELTPAEEFDLDEMTDTDDVLGGNSTVIVNGRVCSVADGTSVVIDGNSISISGNGSNVSISDNGNIVCNSRKLKQKMNKYS